MITSMDVRSCPMAVLVEEDSQLPAGRRLAEELRLPLWQDDKKNAGMNVQFVLYYHLGVLTLRSFLADINEAISVDFLSGKMKWRQTRHLQGELLIKAVGGRKAKGQQIVDATAGLGQDGYILAAAGFDVLMLERDPIVHALLRDGLFRAKASTDPLLARTSDKLVLRQVDSCEYLAQAGAGDVVYLDPMFPQRKKTAKVKKQMQVLQALLASKSISPDIAEEQQVQLLASARRFARKRVVVKRPRLAPFLAGEAPDLQFRGKTSRFDVYLNRPLSISS